MKKKIAIIILILILLTLTLTLVNISTYKAYHKNYFYMDTYIDIKLKYTKIQLQETEEFKKGLLQQMFIVRINWRCNFKLAKSPSFNKHLLILKNKIIFIIIE